MILGLYEIDPDYLEGLETENPVNGAYRDLRQYLPMLAKFYLSKNRKESLKGFTESTGTFQIALGGDGCPFGKNESACSFLVSFLKGALSRAYLQKFNSPKTCLHHWKPINSGQLFLKLLYQCTEARYRVISLGHHQEL